MSPLFVELRSSRLRSWKLSLSAWIWNPLRTYSSGVHAPVLVSRFLARPRNFAGVLNLLPHCTPNVYAIQQEPYMELLTLELVECDTIEELSISLGRLYPNVFDTFDASTPPYPSLWRLHFNGFGFTRKSEQIAQLKRWTSVSRVEQFVFTKCNLREEDIVPLQEVVAVNASW